MEFKLKIDKKWDEWTEAINRMAQDSESEIKTFLKNEGKKGRAEFKDYFKEKHNDSGKTYKAWKNSSVKGSRGKLVTDIYAYSPVLHLLEDGHAIVLGGPRAPKVKRYTDKNGIARTKSGHVVGFVKGYKPFSIVSTIVTENYIKSSDEFLSRMLGMYNL